MNMCEQSSASKYDDNWESGTEGDVRDPKRHTPRTVSMGVHVYPPPSYRVSLLISDLFEASRPRTTAGSGALCSPRAESRKKLRLLQIAAGSQDYYSESRKSPGRLRLLPRLFDEAALPRSARRCSAPVRRAISLTTWLR